MSKIKAVITDVDGCLTDGAIYQFRSGDIARRFSTLDGHGFSLLRERGIKVAFMTSAGTGEKEILERADWLNIEYVYMGVGNKGAMTRYFSSEYLVPLDDIAFLGNDFNDLEAMKICGFSGCPSDAHKDVKAISEYVCERRGGEGAFREFAEIILYNELF